VKSFNSRKKSQLADEYEKARLLWEKSNASTNSELVYGNTGKIDLIIWNVFYFFGILSRIFLRKRTVHCFNVNGINVLPIPLCMSSVFRSQYKKIPCIPGQVDIILYRTEEKRILSAYNKKILAGNTPLKQFILGRCGFRRTDSFDQYVKKCIKLTSHPFYDLHWTSIPEFLGKFGTHRTCLVNIDNAQEVNWLKEYLGLEFTVVNSTAKVLSKLQQ